MLQFSSTTRISIISVVSSRHDKDRVRFYFMLIMGIIVFFSCNIDK